MHTYKLCCVYKKYTQGESKGPVASRRRPIPAVSTSSPASSRPPNHDPSHLLPTRRFVFLDEIHVVLPAHQPRGGLALLQLRLFPPLLGEVEEVGAHPGDAPGRESRGSGQPEHVPREGGRHPERRARARLRSRARRSDALDVDGRVSRMIIHFRLARRFGADTNAGGQSRPARPAHHVRPRGRRAASRASRRRAAARPAAKPSPRTLTTRRRGPLDDADRWDDGGKETTTTTTTTTRKRRFFRTLARVARLARPYFSGDSGARARALLFAVVTLCGGTHVARSRGFAGGPADMGTSFSWRRRAPSGLYAADARRYVAVIAVAAPLFAAYAFVQNTLALEWRTTIARALRRGPTSETRSSEAADGGCWRFKNTSGPWK